MQLCRVSVQLQPATDCCCCSGARKNGTATLHQYLCGVAHNPPHMFYQADYQSRAVSVSKDSPVSLGDNVQLFLQTFIEPSLQKQAESSPKVSTRGTHKSEGTDGFSLTQLCCNQQATVKAAYFHFAISQEVSPLPILPALLFLPDGGGILFLFQHSLLVPAVSCYQKPGDSDSDSRT